MDIDEVEDDFRSTKTSSRKHKPIRDKKRTTPKAKRVKKTDLCLKLTSKKLQEKSSTDDGITTDDNVVDGVSSNRKESKSGVLDVKIETCHCPSCGELFDNTQLPGHVKLCLHKKFGASRPIGFVQRSAFKSAGERLSGGATSSEWSFCTFCGTNLFSLNIKQRNKHINRCLDSKSDQAPTFAETINISASCSRTPSQKESKKTNKVKPIDSQNNNSQCSEMAMEESNVPETVKEALSHAKKIQKANSKVKKKPKATKKGAKTAVQDEKFRCSLCLIKVCASRAGLRLHMHHCQKKHKITTACAMALNKPYNSDNDFADDEILSQIRRIDEHKNENAEDTALKTSKGKKKRNPRKKKNDIAAENEKMLQLALRVSAGDDLECKKSKKQKSIRLPVMIELSPNTKRQQLEGRFRSITNPPVEALADEIPSTPALPPSTFANSKVRILNRNQASVVDQKNSDEAGPSGISPRQTPRKSVNISANNDSQTSTSSCQNMFCGMLNEELQSPEVSSSTIKAMSRSDNVDSYSMNPSVSNLAMHKSPRRTKRQSSNLHRRNWSLACYETSTSNSDYRVRNLLSQFDKSMHNEDSSHGEDQLDAQPTSDETNPLAGDVSHANENVDDADHIDSTLALMKELDATPSLADEEFFDKQISSSQQLVSQKLCILIDNQRFSDAKVYVGEKREVVHLHKTILYCNCSKLLNEIIDAAAKEETVWLQNYTKQEVMPMIHFIYSGKIEPLVNAAKCDLNLFTKTKELLEKYLVLITDTDQIILDQAISEHQKQSQGCQYNNSATDSFSAGQHSEHVDGGDASSVKTGGCLATDDLMLEKKDESFSNELLPRNLTQQDPTHASQVSSEENSFHNMSGISDSDYDLFAWYDKSEDGDECIQHPGDDIFVNNDDSDPKDPLENDFSADPADSRLPEDNLLSSSPSFHHKEEGSSSMSDIVSSTPRKSNDELVSTTKKHKKTDDRDMRVRKSVRASLGKMQRSFDSGSGWHHRDCYCCTVGALKKARTSDKSVTDKNLRKFVSSKRQSDKKINSTLTDIEKTTLHSSPQKVNSRKRRSSSQPSLMSTASPFAISPKKRLSQPKHDENTSGSDSMQKSLTYSDSERRSVTKKRRKADPKRKSLPRKNTQSQTIYIGERLPRFKQREHIRSRPEIANMGKSTRGLPRALNRKTSCRKSATRKIPPAKTLSAPLDSKNQFFASLIKPAGDTGSNGVCGGSSEQSMGSADVCEATNKQTVEDIVHGDANLEEITMTMDTETMADHVNLISTRDERSPAAAAPKKYRFRKVHLAGYALPSPLRPRKVEETKSEEEADETSDDSFEQLEDDLLKESFVEKFLDLSCKSSRLSHMDGASTPVTPIVTTGEHSRRSSIYGGPVPITPMPNFQKMATPEVLERASKIGLKKTLPKIKLKAKLEENYLYHHQLEPEKSFADNDNLEREKSEKTVKLKEVTPQTSVYSFISLPVEEIFVLSTDVVEQTHKNGALLKALQLRKSETGSIKRGSRQDLDRCWDIVTPGRPHYDIKLSAIVSLQEDVQNAISRPLTGCVAKNYLEYKKYQFECLRFLCDEMEQLFKKRSSS